MKLQERLGATANTGPMIDYLTNPSIITTHLVMGIKEFTPNLDDNTGLNYGIIFFKESRDKPNAVNPGKMVYGKNGMYELINGGAYGIGQMIRSNVTHIAAYLNKHKDRKLNEWTAEMLDDVNEQAAAYFKQYGYPKAFVGVKDAGMKSAKYAVLNPQLAALQIPYLLILIRDNLRSLRRIFSVDKNGMFHFNPNIDIHPDFMAAFTSMFPDRYLKWSTPIAQALITNIHAHGLGGFIRVKGKFVKLPHISRVTQDTIDCVAIMSYLGMNPLAEFKRHEMKVPSLLIT